MARASSPCWRRRLSLFDVADLRRPRRLAQASLGADSSSEAEFDPHAFLYWGPASLAVLPAERYDRRPFAGAYGFRIGAASIGRAGELEHEAPNDALAPIRRSLVIGDRRYTLSGAGLGVNRLSDLGRVAFTGFEQSGR